jgi:probable rRNA maturation factor
MLDVAVTLVCDWPEGDEAAWEARCLSAVRAGVEVTPLAALAGGGAVVEVSVRLTDDAEVHELNRTWRNKDKPTNVLSFPQVQPDLLGVIGNADDGELLLGDIVLARETCAAEAAEKGVALEAYVSHLVVHGTLHLLGYDHLDDDEADRMEDLERAAMASLGFADPYASDFRMIDGD